MATIIPPLRIVPLHTLADCREVEEVQRQAWGIQDDDLQVVPTHILMAIAHNGGIMLGCRDASNALLGFVCSFLAAEQAPDGAQRLKHHSHQMGVVPHARGLGLGRRLKLAQRQAALAQGIPLITWTYDPLEPVNARLNIGQLRAIARRYYRDLYGDMGGINAGIPTDRFEVAWWLDSPRVLAGLAAAPVPPSGGRRLEGGQNAAGLPLPYAGEVLLDGGAPKGGVPASYQQIKHHDPAPALEWRLRSRDYFEHAFAAGYLVTEAWAEGVGEAQRSFYELSIIDDQNGRHETGDMRQET